MFTNDALRLRFKQVALAYAKQEMTRCPPQPHERFTPRTQPLGTTLDLTVKLFVLYDDGGWGLVIAQGDEDWFIVEQMPLPINDQPVVIAYDLPSAPPLSGAQEIELITALAAYVQSTREAA